MNLEDNLQIKRKLLEGALLIYPTDTVYGLGAVIDNEESLKKIYEAKSRAFSSPLIALVSSVDKIEKIAHIDEKNERMVKELAKNFWPGALTIILKKKDIVPGIMVSNGDTVGIRIPDLKISLDIIEMAGGILATTSANISGEPSPRSYAELTDEIKSRVDIVIDGGECKIGEVSTIIDLTKSIPKILRKGAISTEEIKKIIGEVEV
ncbi:MULTISPECIES: L-threonylcarbamoyladenylate synthase [Fusobacterium]|uniref:L-threonylcarbamoyladenylate synthase n=1 Tax=Fusobacterium TaxID=848 RepID=UPI001F5008FE|nr:MULTISPECIES: L-threonylcarbamoyladenylate synthase [Fusobacterium]MDD7392043.1 L-threonylcarbamoyladenylate synthase [Fusobacteriaceae bacterium]MCI5724785.1 threonylcarbamoyl-AMP synthase [Fusobacterium sp.]MCI7223985.1 threonylcarbamoyl-AMP synthase [Fusobacterium sp.]MDD7410230.1 L-threonylcarbamoyladenylate synthase [Fusobacteriaceae bacterium]MDY5712614.1 L-threonylcarbamoyladenylate synthase [Fusobacterium gastrosuis]